MTAIQWLKDQYMKADEPAEVLKILLAFEEAIKLEKQQMEDAFNEGYNIRRAYRESDNYVTSTEYYNSIYGSNSEKPNLSEIPTSFQTENKGLDWLVSHWKKLKSEGEKMNWEQIIQITELAKDVPSSQTEISDGEIQSTAETFWTEPSESDMKRGWKLGAKWYREQLKTKNN